MRSRAKVARRIGKKASDAPERCEQFESDTKQLLTRLKP